MVCLQSLSAFEGSHSALSSIYLDQASLYDSKPAADKKVLPPTLLDDHTYRRVYDLIKARLCPKGERDTTVDPQRNTIKDTYDSDDLARIVDCLMGRGTPETDRALAMAMWSHSSVGRSDDVRLFYLADLITPQYIPSVGRWPSSLPQPTALNMIIRYDPCQMCFSHNVLQPPPGYCEGATRWFMLATCLTCLCMSCWCRSLQLLCSAIGAEGRQGTEGRAPGIFW